MQADPVLIVGCGDIGLGLARRLVDQGRQVYGLRRNAAALPSWIVPIAVDITESRLVANLDLPPFSQVVITTTAGEYSEQRYRSVYVDGLANVLGWLRDRPPSRILLASSTSVYGQTDGSRIDEDSPAEPAGFAGRVMLEAENLLADSGLPGTAVRFGGIYGPGRSRLLNRLRAGYIVSRQCDHYSNRIHSADCAAVLAHLLAADGRGRALADRYLAVDSAPTPLRDVCEWLVGQMGLELTAMAEEPVPARGGNKRCSNRRLLESGYRFIYPDYRAGFGALLRESG